MKAEVKFASVAAGVCRHGDPVVQRSGKAVGRREQERAHAASAGNFVSRVDFRLSPRARTEHEQHCARGVVQGRSEEHTSELQSRENLVCRLLLEKKKREDVPTVNDQHMDDLYRANMPNSESPIPQLAHTVSLTCSSIVGLGGDW